MKSTAKPSLLDAVGKFAALATSGSLVVSIIYDWGFFTSLGLSFRQLPTSLADHARSALDWAPSTAIGVSLYILVEFMFDRLQEVNSNLGGWGPVVMETTQRRFNRIGFMSAILFPVLIFAGYVIFGDHISILILPAITILYVASAGWLWWAFDMAAKFPSYFRYVMIVVPIIFVYVYFNGCDEAIALSKKPPVDVIQFSADHRQFHATVLRYFDKGVLYIDEGKLVSFSQWSAIDRVTMATRGNEPFHGIVCSWFGIGCGEKVAVVRR